MPTSIVGNDLVDLCDQEVRSGEVHPRFDERVMTPKECDAIHKSKDSVTLRWIFWAIKEAAFKAVRQIEPEVMFSPRLIRVKNIQGFRATINWEGRILQAWFEANYDHVHAVVTQGLCPEETVRGCAMLPSKQKPGDFVRVFALSTIQSEYDSLRSTLRIVSQGRIPRLVLSDNKITIPLSFSHHGRFVAFASGPINAIEDKT